MAEKHSTSKLKRNKPSVKDLQPAVRPLQRSHAASLSSELTAGRSAWGSSEQRPAEESLWLSVLKSELPDLEDQNWDQVPDLPLPSAAKPFAVKLDERWLCDLGDEVAPFPEPSPPSPRTSRSPDPAGSGSSQQELSVHGRLGPASSHSGRSHDGETASPQELADRAPPPRSWGGPASSAGAPGGGAHGGRTGGEEDTGPVCRRPRANQGTPSDGRVHLQRQEEEEEEAHTSVRGGGGDRELQSCPMCLMVFPVGFSQMDCDGHLAQCLSEVNVDMSW
ncbi:Fanconi anemia core complex-associated protein 20 [Pseudoliparis swirei]|uniref:Fanconi anemia core complex-associated protein 20 n=1 Tax=Pseudoliparis swirei TaxID=2059687 RepID=UPI0024BD9904|nr:Fanconi anemia core complex-associated protein 20 [Pseudoliparis swirei]